MKLRLPVRFRAKYFWSAFLVLGVLSITIGANRLDPLIVRALILQDTAAKLFDESYVNGPHLEVQTDAGPRSLVLVGTQDAAKDPQKMFPLDPFTAFSDAIEEARVAAYTAQYEKRKKSLEALNPKTSPDKNPPKPGSEEDPYKYIRAPQVLAQQKPKTGFDWNAWNPFAPKTTASKPTPQPSPENPVPKVAPIVGLEWRATDPKNVVILRSENRKWVTPYRDIAPIAGLPKKAADILGQIRTILESSLQMGKVGSFVAEIEIPDGDPTESAGRKRVVALGDPTYVKLYRDMEKLKADIEKASDERSVYPVGDKRQTAVLEAADVYFRTQVELYSNYLRNAHAEDDAVVQERLDKIKANEDAKMKAYSGAGGVVYVSPMAYNNGSADKEARMIDRNRGANRFGPHAFDVLNLKLDAKTALPLYSMESLSNWAGQRIAKPFNVRHASDGKLGYQRIELYINAEEKRLLEYSLLVTPKTKHQYMKLLQATALRERMTNRWSLRRMLQLQVWNNERKAQVCATDLVSYRLNGPTGVDDMENYSSLWQQDRYNDLKELRPKVLPVLANHPLLTDDGYVDLILKVVSGRPEFGAFLTQHYGGNVDAFITELKTTYAPQIKALEESKFVEKTEELMIDFNLPGDDLSIPAVAERSSWKAFDARKNKLSDLLIELSNYFGFPMGKMGNAMTYSDQVIDEFMKTIEVPWRTKQRADLTAALKKAWDQSFTADQNQKRYLDFEKSTLAIAAPGARAVQLENAVTAAIKGLDKTYRFSEDRTKAEYYTKKLPNRIAYPVGKLKDRMVPITPDQLSRLFYKKIELLTDGDGPKMERDQIGRIVKDRAVMRYMDVFFAEVAGQYQQAAQKIQSTPPPPPISGVVKSKQKKRAPTSTKNTEEVAAPAAEIEIDETNTPLGDVLVDAVKKTMADFQKALETPPKAPVYDPDDNPFFFQWMAPQASQSRFQSMFGPMGQFALQSPGPWAGRPNDQSAKYLPFGVARKKKKEAPEESFYLEDKTARIMAKGRLQEAFSLIGLSIEAAGANWASGFKHEKGTSQVLGGSSYAMTTSSYSYDYWELSNLLGLERILQMQMPASATRLEKTAASLLDQQILANIVENEAYGRAPILAMQNTDQAVPDKNPKGRLRRFFLGTYFVPSLLRVVSPYFNRDVKENNGWNIPETRGAFYSHMYRAISNDRGKVEDFCEADLRSYETNDKFKLMFKSITGLRDAFASQEPAKTWDEEITKEIRTPSQAFLEDFIDPISMYLMIGIILIMAWQFAPIILGFLTAAGSATTIGGVFAAAGSMFGTFGSALLTLFVGNLSPIAILFTTQSVLMASVFCYQLPPQTQYAFQVANSQIHVDQVYIANREKLHEQREELITNRAWARFGVVMEVFQFSVFTAPGVWKTLGMKGAKRFAKLAEGVDHEIVAAAKGKTIQELIKENGLRKGLAIYSDKLMVAAKTVKRISAVADGTTAENIAEIMVQRAAPHMKDKGVLRAIYGIDETTKESTGILRSTEAGMKETEKTIAELKTKLYGEKNIGEVKRLEGEIAKFEGKIAAARSEAYIQKAEAYVTKLQSQIDALRKSSRWADARAYLRNWAYKYGKDAKYFSLVVAKDYETAAATGKLVMTAANAKEIRIAVEMAKLQDQAFKAAYLRKFAKILNYPGELSEAQVLEHLRRLTLSDWEIHEQLILDAVRRPSYLADAPEDGWKIFGKWKVPFKEYGPDATSAKYFKDIFKQLRYVVEDYKVLNPKAVTVARAIKEGVADLIIDGTGKENPQLAKDLVANPENYEFLSIPLKDL